MQYCGGQGRRKRKDCPVQIRRVRGEGQGRKQRYPRQTGQGQEQRRTNRATPQAKPRGRGGKTGDTNPNVNDTAPKGVMKMLAGGPGCPPLSLRRLHGTHSGVLGAALRRMRFRCRTGRPCSHMHKFPCKPARGSSSNGMGQGDRRLHGSRPQRAKQHPAQIHPKAGHGVVGASAPARVPHARRPGAG